MTLYITCIAVWSVFALVVMFVQIRTIKRMDRHIEIMMADNINDYAAFLRARTDVEYYKQQAFQANMVLAALYKYPSDEPEQLDTSDPRSGAGTVH